MNNEIDRAHDNLLAWCRRQTDITPMMRESTNGDKVVVDGKIHEKDPNGKYSWETRHKVYACGKTWADCINQLADMFPHKWDM